MTQYYGKPSNKIVKVNKQKLKGMVELKPYPLVYLKNEHTRNQSCNKRVRK